MILVTVFSSADQGSEGHKPPAEKSSVAYCRVGTSAPTRYEGYKEGMMY